MLAMQEDYQDLGRHSNWWPDNKINQAKLDRGTDELLTNKGSLTTSLIHLSEGNFEVNLLSQGIAVPYWHEQKKLIRCQSRAAMIREVELKIYGVSVVYARSIIPLALVRDGKSGLANLGRTPLGHLLFRDGRIRVSKRDLTIINYAGGMINARRTPYDYQGSSVLVSEFFLPAMASYV